MLGAKATWNSYLSRHEEYGIFYEIKEEINKNIILISER